MKTVYLTKCRPLTISCILAFLLAGISFAEANLLIQGSNLGCWGTNSNGTINEPFLSNTSEQKLATPVIGLMRFPCRQFTASQLQTIASAITNAGLVPLAVLDDQDATKVTALAQLNALKGIVTYYEVGNEDNYFHGWSGTTYATNWANFIPSLRSAAPNAKFIGPVGSAFNSTGSTYMSDFLNWIKTNSVSLPDIVSMHYYSGHGDIPAWTTNHILSDVTTNMLPGVSTLESNILSITGTAIPLAITEWNYDAAPQNNTNLLYTNSIFMHSYTFEVLNGFQSEGVWGACEYDFGSGAANGYLDMVTTSGNPNPQYGAFTNWFSLYGSGQPPSITTQPQSQTVNQGANVTFSVTASGTTPLSYQWQFIGTNISGATSSTYTLDNVQSANAGYYSVVVTNMYGKVTSSNAVLTVNTNSTPPISLVRSSQNLATAGGSSISTTLTNNAGDALVVACRQGTDGTSISSVTDSAGNTYKLVANSSSGTRESAVYVATNVIASSANTVTCTFASDLASVEGIVVLEFANAAPLDGHCTSTNTGSVTSLSSGTINTTQSGDVLIYAVNASVNESTWTAGSSYTIPANGSNARQGVEYFVAGASGAESTSISWNAATSADGEYLALAPSSKPSMPPISLVRSSQNLATAGGSSISTTLTNNAGDALVVACRQGTDGTSISNVTDSAGNTYHLVNTAASGTRESAVYVATNVVASSANTVTCTFASDLASVEGIVVLEFANAAPLDGHCTSTNTGSVTSLSSGTINTTQSGDVLIYAVNASVNESTWTAGSSYTIPANGSNARQGVEYFVAGAPGAKSTSLSWNASGSADGEYLALAPVSTGGNQPALLIKSLVVQSNPPQFGMPVLSGGQLTLTWSNGTGGAGAGGGILQSATNLNGPWTDATNAASPYTAPVNPSTPQQFYRVKQQ